MSRVLYASCAEVLSLAQSQKDDLTALLDPQTGFAPKLRQICRDRLADLEGNIDENASKEADALRMESDTWALLQAIMAFRKTAQNPSITPNELLAENPYTPTEDLAQAIMDSSTLLSELVIIREWLQESAPNPPPTEAATGYWKFTKYDLAQNARMGKGKEKDVNGGLVTEMDPDAVNRGEARSLAADDAAYDKALIQSLYAYVRAGRLDDAYEACHKAHQPWRAASIRGSLLFRWHGIVDASRDENAMDDDELNVGWRGNQRRKLWKSTCTRAAMNPTLSTAERALYAALAPCPQTFVHLKAACRTWEDYLWAQISIICEEKESSEMSRLHGSFWEGSARTSGGTDNAIDQDEDDEWEREVRETLSSLSNISVEEGAPADNPYHSCQLHIILGQMEQLLEGFAVGLQRRLYDPTSPDYAIITRFFAHLCLFLQMIDESSSPVATQAILEAYLQVLENAGQRELIAMYVSALGDTAVSRYALFLVSLHLSVDINERRLALSRAREHGLDMDRVAVATAEKTIGKAFESLSPLRGPLADVQDGEAQPTDPELFLVRSIEWTTFMESTYDTALEQANVILRYFLATGKVEIAKTVLAMLPRELASIREPEERATEYLHYRQLFVAWDALSQIEGCKNLESPQMAKDTRIAWLEDYKSLTNSAREQVIKLLTTEWLVSEAERSDPTDRRIRELIRIRQIFIPELILRLHTALYESRVYIPANLKYALSLANIVADSRYKLYDDFTNQDGKRLRNYLAAIRQAILGGLEGGGSDPFRAVTA